MDPQLGARSRELPPDLPVGAGAQAPRRLPLQSQEHQQGAGSEVEPPGPELLPTRDLGSTGSIFPRYATTPPLA